jgi:hypothetical protein
MSLWRETVLLTLVVLILNAGLGKLLALAVTAMHPDIDPGELYGRINFVLTCATVLGLVWYYRRKGDTQAAHGRHPYALDHLVTGGVLEHNPALSVNPDGRGSRRVAALD